MSTARAKQWVHTPRNTNDEKTWRIFRISIEISARIESISLEQDREGRIGEMRVISGNQTECEMERELCKCSYKP